MSYELVFGGLLRALGAFYALGSLLVLWGTLTSAFADQATATIEARPVPRMTRWKKWWLLGSAVLLFACGLSLILLVNVAGPLFMLSAAGQTLYLVYLAPFFFDPAEAPEAAGRRSTRNALLVFLLATGFVLAAWSRGWLRDWRDLPPAVLAMAVGVALFVLAYAVHNARRLS